MTQVATDLSNIQVYYHTADARRLQHNLIVGGAIGIACVFVTLRSMNPVPSASYCVTAVMHSFILVCLVVSIVSIVVHFIEKEVMRRHLELHKNEYKEKLNGMATSTIRDFENTAHQIFIRLVVTDDNVRSIHLYPLAGMPLTRLQGVTNV